MSSRAEEKARRRAEREALEKQAQSSDQRRKRLALIGGGVLVAAIAAIVALAVLGGDDESPKAAAAIPAKRISDLDEAAKAAGCKVTSHPSEGQQHVTKEFKASDYKTNPPTSGPHYPPPAAEDGMYAAGNEPNLGKLVHALEHGRINIQYNAGSPQRTVAQLEALYNEMSEGYHLLLYENTTGMKEAVAATAWTQKLGCPEMNDKVFDAIRTFRARYIDKGPERVP